MAAKNIAFALPKPPTVLPNTTVSLPNRAFVHGSSCKFGVSGGGFTEMIRGITRLPSVADVHSLMHVRLPAESAQIIRPEELAGKTMKSEPQPFSPHPADRPNPQLVTLPLLPETPSRSCICPFKASSSSNDFKDPTAGTLGGAALVDDYAEISVPKGSPSASDGSVVDHAYLEQVYGGSTDPVVLLSDGNEVLWFNKAYARASKSATERMSGKVVASGPYIDPLGHPIPLGSSGQSPTTSNMLWGFLRKLVVVEPDSFLNEECREVCETSDDLGITEQSATDLGLRLGDVCKSPRGKQATVPPCNSMQESYSPVFGSSCRLVAMSVTLESVSATRTDASPLSECLETVEARLEGSMPAFITDSYDRVRWANSAYKKLVDQSESSLTSATVKQESVFCRSPTLTVGSGEKIPRSAAAFSGRVNIQLFKAGVRSCMIVPCDVCRLITGSKADMWVWEFDIAAGLSLTCGNLSTEGSEF